MATSEKEAPLPSSFDDALGLSSGFDVDGYRPFGLEKEISVSHFQFIADTVGIDRILFAVDYPYLTLPGARAWLEAVR